MEIYRKSNQKYTMVSDIFIEEYMSQANGEFVKVYLLLLKGLSNEENITISDLADCLQCTDKDIVRALNFWHDKGVLELEWSGKELCGVMVLDLESTKKPKPKAVEPKKESKILMPKENKPRRKQTFNDPEFGQLLYVTEQYLGKPITPSDYQSFINLYENLQINIDLLEFAVEYCVKNNHKNVRYIESVVIDWHKNKITTVAQAKERSTYMRQEVRTVMKAFGIFGRKLTDKEIGFVDTWFEKNKYPEELVVEACKRSLGYTKMVSFDYANKILTEWEQKSIKNLDGVKQADADFEAKKNQKIEKKLVNNRDHKTRFHNFEERENDYDALVEELSSEYF